MASHSTPQKKPRRHIWPYLWVALLAAWFGSTLMRELERAFSDGAVAVPLDISETGTSLNLGEGHGLLLDDVVTASVPLGELAGGTVFMLLGGRIALFLGIIAAALLAARAMSHMSRGEVFSETVIRSTSAIASIGLVTWMVSQYMLHFGANMTARDLDVTSEVTSGVWGPQFIVGLAVAGGILILAGVLHSGKEAQDDLEGLV